MKKSMHCHFIIHEKDTAYERGKKDVRELKKRSETVIRDSNQAAIRGKIIARETVRAMRKDDAGKMLVVEISAVKESFWKTERREKKRECVRCGALEIPQKAFMSVLKLDDK